MTINKPSDQSVRQQALDTRRSFIVKAPAGSGKTTLLVKRYLCLLCTVNHPEEVIAITFTRKAAGEMVSKTITALTDSQSQAKVDDPELMQIAEKTLAHSQHKGWGLLDNPSRLRIQTVDALSGQLVAQMPWSAGFGTAPTKIADDVTALYRKASEQSLLGALTDKQHKPHVQYVLLSLDNNFTRTCELLVSMLAKRDQWQKLLLKEFSAGDARKALEANWEQTADRLLQLTSRLLSEEVKSELLSCAKYAAAQLQQRGCDSPVLRLIEMHDFPEPSIQAIDDWLALCELLLKRSGPRKSADKNIGFPSKKDGGDDQIKKKFINLLNRLEGSDFIHHLMIIKNLPDSAFSDSEWRLLAALVELLKLATAELMLVFQQQGVCDYIEMAHRANLALGDPQHPTDLSLRLDYQIKHLLIDEFQDTSHTQMELFRRLTAGWQIDEGRTVFMVGDPMQSIYRFREADVGLYLNTFKHGFGSLEIQPLVLGENFRSTKVLVDWINDSFGKIFPDRDDPQSAAVQYMPSNAFHESIEKQHYVRIHPVDRQCEAETVCHQIGRILAQTGPQEDIAVLVRSRAHLDETIALLKQKSLDFQGLKLEKLSNRSCIKDLLALTLALTHPGDKLSWLAVLRAPWCGMDLVDLTHIATRADGKTVWQVMQDAPKIIKADNALRLERLCSVLKPALEKISRQPLHFIVSKVWQSLGGPDTVNPADFANVQAYFLQLAEFQSAGQIGNLSDFLNAIEQQWAVTDGTQTRVMLMTMHNAKGLEFDTVLLPGLYKKPGVDDTRLLIWNQFMLDKMESALLVSPIKATLAENKRYDFVKTLDKQAQHQESIRLLYVACTRAKKRLHLFVNQKPAANSLQVLLNPVIDTEFEPLDSDSQRDRTLVMDDQINYRRLPLNYFPADRPASLTMQQTPSHAGVSVEYQWAGMTARHLGTLIHEVIQAIALGHFKPADNPCRWHNYLLALGMDRQDIAPAIEQIKLASYNMLNKKRARWILDTSHRCQKNEWELSGSFNGNLENIKIDRTFIDKHGTRWIIDYKTSTHQGGKIDLFLDNEVQRYRDQLEKYAALIRLTEPNTIKLGLYFPLLDAWREWEYAG